MQSWMGHSPLRCSAVVTVEMHRMHWSHQGMRHCARRGCILPLALASLPLEASLLPSVLPTPTVTLVMRYLQSRGMDCTPSPRVSSSPPLQSLAWLLVCAGQPPPYLPFPPPERERPRAFSPPGRYGTPGNVSLSTLSVWTHAGITLARWGVHWGARICFS